MSVKVAYLVSHPIQYQAPLLKHIVEHSNVDLTALFMSDFSVRSYHDKEFGTELKWDVPLLEGYKHQFLPTVGGREKIDNPRPFVPNFKKILKEGEFDVLWSHGYAHQNSVRAIAAAKSLGMDVMVRAESQWASALGTGIRRKAKEVMIRRVFGMVDAFLCIGSANQQYYTSFEVPDSKMFLVPYAVDNERFQQRCNEARPKAAEFKMKLDMDLERPVVLYASKLTARKKITDLMAAFEIAFAAAPDGRKPYLMIAGDGEQRPELEQWMASGWAEHTRFLGFQNQTELPLIYAASDLFVLASAREPWGLVVNEVMNAEMPVVVSDEVGSAYDLVQEGETGWVIKVGDIQALANCITKICLDPGLSAQMGRAAMERVSQWGYEEDLDGILQALQHLGYEARRNDPPFELRAGA